MIAFRSSHTWSVLGGLSCHNGSPSLRFSFNHTRSIFFFIMDHDPNSLKCGTWSAVRFTTPSSHLTKGSLLLAIRYFYHIDIISEPTIWYISQALQSDFLLCYEGRHASKRNKRPWDLPNPKQNAPKHRTLFSQKYLTFIIDEAHDMRNVGVKHWASLSMSKNSLVKVAATATPLQTSHTVCVK